MKTLIVLAMLLYPSATRAAEWFEPFSKADWGYQLTYTFIAGADWRQTQVLTKDPTKYERLFILGDNPSRTKVDVMIGGAIVVHGLISYALPQTITINDDFVIYPRRIWQCVWIGIEADAVEHNYQLGISISI